MREPQMGQLTLVTRPFLVTEATICPRSSPQVTHICSTRSPTAKICFSTFSVVILLLIQGPHVCCWHWLGAGTSPIPRNRSAGRDCRGRFLKGDPGNQEQDYQRG